MGELQDACQTVTMCSWYSWTSVRMRRQFARPYSFACENHWVGKVTKFLQNPVDPNWRGAGTVSPPVFVVNFKGHLEVVQLLLEAGADKNAVSANGATAMMSAAQHGHLEVVRVLLGAGAEKNAATANRVTALMVAALDGHLEVVQLLLEALTSKQL